MTHLEKPQIVVIVGGTGVSTILKEVKKVSDVTAVASMIDPQPITTFTFVLDF